MFRVNTVINRRVWKFSQIQKRRFFNFLKRPKDKSSTNSDIVTGETQSEVKIKIDDEVTALSNDVKVTVDNQSENAQHIRNKHSFSMNRFFEVTLLTASVGVGFGFLYHHYYSVNDAEAIQLWYHHPHRAQFLHNCYILSSDIEKKYEQYDYSLYIARLAAAILSDPNHRVSSIPEFLSLLQEWLDLSSLEFDDTIEFNHSSILSILSSIRQLDSYFTIYILGERLYQVSPLVSNIQSEINQFYNFAKEDEEGRRGVHTLYVLSILRHIENHYDMTLYYPICQRQPLWSFLQAPAKRHCQQQRLSDLIKEGDVNYLSLIQLTNILACADRQIPSDSLLIYRLRLASKKVEEDRRYQEECKRQDELRRLPIIPLLTKENQKIQEESPKTVEEVLEEEIVKNTKPIENVDKQKQEEEEEWW